MNEQTQSKLTPNRRSSLHWPREGHPAFAWIAPLVEKSSPHKESTAILYLWHFTSSALVLPSWASVHFEEDAEYRALLHTSVTSFEFCQPWAHLILMEVRRETWWLERVQGRMKSFSLRWEGVVSVWTDRVELEKKTDCRCWRGRGKCRTHCGTLCCREADLGLSPSQSWWSHYPCQGLAWEWACDPVLTNKLDGRSAEGLRGSPLLRSKDMVPFLPLTNASGGNATVKAILLPPRPIPGEGQG